MADELQVSVCHRCGRGYLLTSTYRDMLARRGSRVVVPRLCPTCFILRGPLPKRAGRVKWYDLRRHYGFLVTEDGGEVFFHERQVVGTREPHLEAGQSIKFHVRVAEKCPEALNDELK